MSANATLVLKPDARVTCPKCEHEFSLEQGFARHALEGIEAESGQALQALREQERSAADKRVQQRERELAVDRQRAVEEAQRIEAERARQEGEQNRQQLEAMRQMLAAAQAQVAQLRAAELQLREDRQKLQDEKDALALEVRRQVDAQLGQREAQARAQEKEQAALHSAELQKKLDDLTAQLAEAQRRAEQGSQQLQGEVLEIALEEALRRSFPLDAIEEVRKGQRGGDVIHRIVSHAGNGAGVLLWETKRASAWNAQWLAKLKEDMRAASADAGVLVTMPGAVPRDWEAGREFGLVEGVWVATWTMALQLAEVLRAALLDVHRQRVASAGKDQKMEAVYDYVTSPQFAQKLRAVNDCIGRMREELESEKGQTLQRWARREKQLEAGRLALLGIGGEIQGLAQQELPQLELEPGRSPPEN
jgi:hypothetical protein